MSNLNWREFFMAIAIAVVFVFQSIQRIEIDDNSNFIEEMEKNRDEIRIRLKKAVDILIDERFKTHNAKYHTATGK